LFLGLVAFLAANVPLFIVATQIFGDLFVLLILRDLPTCPQRLPLCPALPCLFVQSLVLDEIGTGKQIGVWNSVVSIELAV